MGGYAREGVRSVLSTPSATANAPSTSMMRKTCVYDGCAYVANSVNEKLLTHNMGSHVSNCHGSQTIIWYGAKQIKIERDAKTQQMRCPCGYSHINSSSVRRHALKEHKASDLKTALLADRASAQPSVSTSRSRPESVSSIETMSPARSVSPIQNSDTPPTSYTSGGHSHDRKGSKSLAPSSQKATSANPRRMSLGMTEQRLSKPVVPRSVTMHAVSGSARKPADTTRVDAPVRSHGPKPSALSDKSRAVSSVSTSSVVNTSRVSQKVAKGPAAAISKEKSSNTDRVLKIAKSNINHPKSHSDVASISSKRPRSPSHADAAAHSKAKKVSRASDASSSSKIPPLLSLQSDLESSDADALPSQSEVVATLLPKPRTHCTTCHTPLGPHSRFKNCDACREKNRVYQRQRKERMEAKPAGLLPVPTSTSSAAPVRRVSSPENDMMNVDEPPAVARPPSAKVRRVWDEVPEFQMEDDLLAAVHRSVLEWRQHAVLATRAGTLTDFEFCGGYAVVAGSAKVNEAIVRRLSGKLVSQGVPMTKQSCFKRLTQDGPATEGAAYHVFNNLSTVFYCTCKDGGAGEPVQRENVCRGRVKIVVETTSEKNEIGAFGQNVVVETSHAW